MDNKVVRPDLKGEMDEIQRISQDLARDEGIELSVKQLVNAFKESEEETLKFGVWEKLENTESNEILKGDIDAVEKIAKQYNKTNPKVLVRAIKSGDYERPLILKLNDRYILVAGNTRLCTAKALGVYPKVFIAKINVSSDLEEKWSEKYKKSIDCNNPKGFSQKAHCQGRKKKMNEANKLKGGLSDNMSLEDIATKHKVSVQDITNEFTKGVKVEMEHTNNKNLAKEIAMDHLFEDPKYYSKLKKIEAKEMTGASSAGGFSAPVFGQVIKKKHITKIHNMTEQEVVEVTDASSSGSYDVPLFGGTKGRKNPLSIGGPDTIYKGRAVKDKNFPKWGGPGGKFVKIKDKCKKYPYCNQGDINALELLESEEMVRAIENAVSKTGLTTETVKNIVLKEIKHIFI